VLPDNRTLVRFAAPRQVQVIDLNRLTLISSVDIEWAPCEACAKKAAPTALYAPDSSLLYVVNGSSGQVAAIDLRAHAAARTSSLPLTGSIRPSGRPSTTGVPDAVVSADGHTLYAIDARSDPPVVWTIGLPALEPLAYWTPGRSLVAVSRDDAERVLFALGGDGLVYGVASNSTIFTAAVPNVAAVTGFLASGSL
jgi:DNA-binding beta-propeller fold protein YncE